MRRNLSRLVDALQGMYPTLTRHQCRLLADEFARIADRGLGEGWDLTTLQLYPRGVRKVSRLAAELRQLRNARGLSQKTVAAAALWSAAKVMRIENGSVRVSLQDLQYLLKFYGVTARDEVKRFEDMQQRRH